ncbi:MAG: hypothetical protein ACI4W6_08910 [Acutalibacteraceae bacterium]
MKKQKRLVAVILAVSVLFAMLFSVCFIATESAHNCVGENCPICCHINDCKEAVKTLASAAVAVLLAAVITYTAVLVSAEHLTLFGFPTLISLKVKLSD